MECYGKPDRPLVTSFKSTRGVETKKGSGLCVVVISILVTLKQENHCSPELGYMVSLRPY